MKACIVQAATLLPRLVQQFGDVELFLRDHDDIGLSTHKKLLDIASQPQKMALLKLELATVVDIGSYFVKATYSLEGDGVLAVKCYEEILKIRNAIHTKHYPNLRAVTRAMSPSDTAAQQQLIDYGLSCVQPGLAYFNEKFGQDTHHLIAVFKVARLFNPIAAMEIQPTADDIEELNVFPFLSPPNIEQLKAELPAYLARASAISLSSDESSDTLSWWKNNSTELPQWSKSAQNVFLIQPSSASAERVFFILNKFSDNQMNSLEDYVESSVMLQYNYDS